MDFSADWDSLQRRAQAEADRYVKLYPLHAERLRDDVADFCSHAVPADEHELILRRIAFTELVESWHTAHLAQVLVNPTR